MTTAQALNLEQKKDSMLAPWKLGDYGALARTLGAREAEAFIARLKCEPKAQALDVACGTGAATIPLARRGVSVTGLDMTRHLLEEARANAVSEALSIRFDEGFAEELPYPDATFDTVISMFGAMFSPHPEAVASEVARVLKPGGQFAMANWSESGFSGRMSAIPSAYFPARPGAISPMLWGDEGTIRERLKNDFAHVETTIVGFNWELQMNALDAAGFFAKSAGPLQLLLNRLDDQQASALLHDLEEFWMKENRASDESRTVVRNEYLQVFAIRR
ncbi:Methyltransferase type 11 [Acidisarcina polymorpha]|uniref:Methyltransferase type 11 n=1 Tax=Acidisarcina polymorpha TaxID=2211140 RepID=A0A2Z5G414_9BACT|nr:class I SAM-dependent methyltransferase [Acidisarcina polymorpha]AXC13544.1 Methyltransferase type 11 [Acidisarcina polymorpha]